MWWRYCFWSAPRPRKYHNYSLLSWKQYILPIAGRGIADYYRYIERTVHYSYGRKCCDITLHSISEYRSARIRTPHVLFHVVGGRRSTRVRPPPPRQQCVAVPAGQQHRGNSQPAKSPTGAPAAQALVRRAAHSVIPPRPPIAFSRRHPCLRRLSARRRPAAQQSSSSVPYQLGPVLGRLLHVCARAVPLMQLLTTEIHYWNLIAGKTVLYFF